MRVKPKDGKLYAEVTLRDVVERSDVSDLPMLSEIKRLYEENDKLRELVRISIEYCNSGTCDECPIQDDDGSCPYAEMALKLGVEVKQ